MTEGIASRAQNGAPLSPTEPAAPIMSPSALRIARQAYDQGDIGRAEETLASIDDGSPWEAGAEAIHLLIARRRNDADGAQRAVKNVARLLVRMFAETKLLLDSDNQLVLAAALKMAEVAYENAAVCPEYCSEAIAQALNLKAVILEKEGRLDEAEAAIDEAAHVVLAPHQPFSQVWPTIAINRSTIKSNLGKLDEAYASLMRAIADFAEIDDNSRRVALLRAAADTAYQSGRYLAARQHYATSIALLETDPEAETEQLARSLVNLSAWEREFGEAKAARDLTRRATVEWAKSSEPEPLWLLSAVVGAEWASGSPWAEIRPLVCRVGHLARAANDGVFGSYLSDLALIAADRKRWRAAERLFAKAIDLTDGNRFERAVRRISDRRHRARALASLSQVRAAEQALTDALVDVGRLGGAASVFAHVLDRDLAEVKERAGDPAAARALYARSIETETRLFEERLSPTDGLAEATGHRDVLDALSQYMRLTEPLVDDASAVREAHRLSMRARQRSIRLLRRLRQACAGSKDLSAAIAEWREVSRWLAWGRRLSAAGVNDPQLASLAFREAELGAAISTLARNISIDVADPVEADLQPGTCAIDFLVTYDRDATSRDVRLYAFVRRPAQDAELIVWRGASSLLLDVEQLRRTIERNGDVDGLLQRLSDALWARLAPHVPPHGTLLVRPDGNLAHLPFPALIGSHGRRLGESYRLVLAQGADSDLQRTHSRGKDDFLILGDPSFRSAWDWRSVLTTVVTGQRRARLSSQELAPLAHARREARLVGRALRGGGMKGRILLGRRAQRDAILRGRPARILHVAAHAFYEPRDVAAKAATSRAFAVLDQPGADWRAGIALAGAGEWLDSDAALDDTDEGLLLARDITLTDLSGFELVVLSACDTSLGEPVPGEGIVSLADSFLAAGVRTVMATLWAVDDRHTADLMLDFYRHLLNGRTVEAALQHASNAAAERGLPPRVWAAFSIFGEAEYTLSGARR